MSRLFRSYIDVSSGGAGELPCAEPVAGLSSRSLIGTAEPCFWFDHLKGTDRGIIRYAEGASFSYAVTGDARKGLLRRLATGEGLAIPAEMKFAKRSFDRL